MSKMSDVSRLRYACSVMPLRQAVYLVTVASKQLQFPFFDDARCVARVEAARRGKKIKVTAVERIWDDRDWRGPSADYWRYSRRIAATLKPVPARSLPAEVFLTARLAAQTAQEVMHA